MKNGTRILAKITEIGLTEIKYKNCNNIDGPTIVVSKKNTKSITYKDGSKELIIYDSNPEKPKKKKFDFIGLASFVLSVFTVFLCINFIGVISSTELFLAIALLGIAAIALGSYSLYLYFNNMGVYKKNAFPYIGIILGAIIAFVSFILLSNNGYLF